MLYDIIIIGAGPAGLTAAIYGCRAGKSVLVIDKGGVGGQINYSPMIENFPGRIAISGEDLADALVEHAMDAGAEINIATIEKVYCDPDDKFRNNRVIKVYSKNEIYEGRVLIIATGAQHRKLNVPGESVVNKNIHYCATCDGAFYKDREVALVGGGNSALQEALMLSDICKKVHVIQNLENFTGEMSLVNKVLNRDNITCSFNSKVTSLSYNGDKVQINVAVNTADKESEKIVTVNGIFVAIGLEPKNELFFDLVQIDHFGYIITDDRCRTSYPAIYAVGDCRVKEIRQITTAMSDGTIAALDAIRYLG